MFLRAFREVWRSPWVRVVVGLLLLTGMFLLLRWARPVWGTLLVAYLLAFVLHPVVALFERRGWPRGAGVLVVTTGLVVAIALFWYLGIRIAAQLAVFAERVPALIELLEELPFLVARSIDPGYGEIFEQVFLSLDATARQLTEGLLPSLGGAQSGLVERFGPIGEAGLQTFAVLVLSVYLLYSFERYNRTFLRLIPLRHRDRVEEVVEYLGVAVGGYLRGQIVIALFVGLATGVGLTLLGVPLAPALGLLAGIGNVIPFVGPLLATVPAVVLALTEGWGVVIGTGAVLLGVQLLDAHVVTPLVYSRVISLDPVVVIVAVLAGTLLLGVFGAVAAVPAAVFLTLLYREYYLESDWYRGRRRRGAEGSGETR